MIIRIKDKSDLKFLLQNDRQISSKRLEQKIRDGLIYVAYTGSSPMGWLRFSYFWDIIPFMDLLFVLETNRDKGIGRGLVEKWESDMFQSGADFVLTSTQSDENAQHFYRKLDYRDCGAIFLPKQVPAEIFLIKTNPIAERDTKL
ncbi:MAG: GNAT family N-acetyltransferase [Proteobacteria bacterium]|nr:GNAT family N-acetyltransferase [Pseudomonadota bacterium]